MHFCQTTRPITKLGTFTKNESNGKKNVESEKVLSGRIFNI